MCTMAAHDLRSRFACASSRRLRASRCRPGLLALDLHADSLNDRIMPAVDYRLDDGFTWTRCSRS
jgi:hypothetical protein